MISSSGARSPPTMGLPTPKEQTAAAARLPVLEAHRQQEIASFSEMWTDESPLAPSLNRAVAGTILDGRYGVDMERIHADEEKTPAATMRREAARQVQLSNAVQAGSATTSPILRSMADVQVEQILGHYDD
jgi:hypothetical protein